MLLAATACACLLCGVITTIIVLTLKHEVHHRHRSRDPQNNINMAQLLAAQRLSPQTQRAGDFSMCPMWVQDPVSSAACSQNGGTCVHSADDCDGTCNATQLCSFCCSPC